MKTHASRYALTAMLGAFTTGLFCIQFSYFGLLAAPTIGILCLMIVPYHEDGAA